MMNVSCNFCFNAHIIPGYIIEIHERSLIIYVATIREGGIYTAIIWLPGAQTRGM